MLNLQLDAKEEFESKKSFVELLCLFINPKAAQYLRDTENFLAKYDVINPTWQERVKAAERGLSVTKTTLCEDDLHKLRLLKQKHSNFDSVEISKIRMFKNLDNNVSNNKNS